ADELGFPSGVAWVRFEADELYARRGGRARAPVPMLAPRNDEHRRPVLPGQLQRNRKAVTWAGEHDDRADIGRHSLRRPYDQARSGHAERHDEDDHGDEDLPRPGKPAVFADGIRRRIGAHAVVKTLRHTDPGRSPAATRARRRGHTAAPAPPS